MNLDQDNWLECLEWGEEPEEIDWHNPRPDEVNWWDPPIDGAYTTMNLDEWGEEPEYQQSLQMQDCPHEEPEEYWGDHPCPDEVNWYRILSTLEKLNAGGVTIIDFFEYLKSEEYLKSKKGYWDEYVKSEKGYWNTPHPDKIEGKIELMLGILEDLEKCLSARGATVTDFFEYLKSGCGQAGHNLGQEDWFLLAEHWDLLANCLGFLANYNVLEKLCTATIKRKWEQIDPIIHLANEYICELLKCGIDIADVQTYNAVYKQAIMRYASLWRVSLTYWEIEAIINRDSAEVMNTPEGTVFIDV